MGALGSAGQCLRPPRPDSIALALLGIQGPLTDAQHLCRQMRLNASHPPANLRAAACAADHLHLAQRAPYSEHPGPIPAPARGRTVALSFDIGWRHGDIWKAPRPCYLCLSGPAMHAHARLHVPTNARCNGAPVWEAVPPVSWVPGYECPRTGALTTRSLYSFAPGATAPSPCSAGPWSCLVLLDGLEHPFGGLATPHRGEGSSPWTRRPLDRGWMFGSLRERRCSCCAPNGPCGVRSLERVQPLHQFRGNGRW